MRSPHRAVIAATAVAAAGLLLTGCGGTSTAQGGTPTHSSSPATPSSGSTDLGTDPTSEVPAPTSAGANPALTSAPGSGGTDSTPGATAGTSSGGSACSLVTEADVTDVLTADPGAGSPFSSHGATQCQYGDYQSEFVLVNLTPSQGKVAYAHFRKDPHISDGGTVADVSGVGDQAFSLAAPMTAAIYFTKGDALVLVMVEIHGAASSPMAQALSLAKLAAGRV